jgi:phage tail protein X
MHRLFRCLPWVVQTSRHPGASVPVSTLVNSLMHDYMLAHISGQVNYDLLDSLCYPHYRTLGFLDRSTSHQGQVLLHGLLLVLQSSRTAASSLIDHQLSHPFLASAFIRRRAFDFLPLAFFPPTRTSFFRFRFFIAGLGCVFLLLFLSLRYTLLFLRTSTMRTSRRRRKRGCRLRRF